MDINFNKEQALRAKELAEAAFQNSDFENARKLALRGDKLDSTLNLSKLVKICDVHFAAQKKIGYSFKMGNKKGQDWHDYYGILQIPATADESMVKSAYKKFALSLHPDKNHFLGAEEAFKLVGEAHQELTDPVKKDKYDNVWWVSHPWLTRPARKTPTGTLENPNPPSSAKHTPTGTSETPHPFSSAKQTPTGTSETPHPFSYAWSSCSHREHPPKTASHQEHPPKTASYTETYSTRKRPRFVVPSSSDSSSSSDSPSSSDPSSDEPVKEEPEIVNLSDDDYVPDVQEKKKTQDEDVEEGKEEKKTQDEDVEEGKEEKDAHDEDVEEGKEEKDAKDEDVEEGKEEKDAQGRGIIFFDVPEFCDFEKFREQNCFQPNQIWALYDDADGMPRVYALIRVVKPVDFMLQCVWLDFVEDQDNEDGRPDLPVSVGEFEVGSVVEFNRLTMFSHFVCSIDGRLTRSSKISVFPKKAETWALFRNWDMLIPPSKYEYDFVEILSDHAEGNKVSVGFLSKVEGYVSVFRPTPKDGSCEILPQEYFRFSHCVPSFRLTGTEGRGVAEGWYELDPAALTN